MLDRGRFEPALRTKRVGAGDDCWATTSVARLRVTVACFVFVIIMLDEGPSRGVRADVDRNGFFDKRETEGDVWQCVSNFILV